MPGDKKQLNIPSLPKNMTPAEMRGWREQAERALEKSGVIIRGIREEQEREERERKESINELVEKLKDAANKADMSYFIEEQYKAIQKEFDSIQLPNLTNDEASDICAEVLAGNTDGRHPLACSVFLNKLANDTGNKVEVTIDGNGKDRLGALLEKGVVMHINGDAGYGAGICMKGGTLTVEGNAGGDEGLWMEGGTLTIKGDAGDYAGRDMKGGELRIHGKVESFYASAFSKNNKGQIYLTNQNNNEILIYNNGMGGPLWNTHPVKRLTKEAYENFKITREGYKIKFEPK